MSLKFGTDELCVVFETILDVIFIFGGAFSLFTWIHFLEYEKCSVSSVNNIR